MARNEIRPIIKLRSTAGTGYTYVTRKNRRNACHDEVGPERFRKFYRPGKGAVGRLGLVIADDDGVHAFPFRFDRPLSLPRPRSVAHLGRNCWLGYKALTPRSTALETPLGRRRSGYGSR